MNKVVSLITYDGLAELDPDDHILKAALERRDVEVKARVWDDETLDWTGCGVGIIRSTWDYHRKFEKFCNWLLKVETLSTIFNEPSLLLWNSRKTYLRELKEAGLPVIPTRFFSKEFRPRISGTLREMGWKEAILKPTIGLASSGVKKFDMSLASIADGERHLESLLEDGEAMLQEFLPSVHYYGERSLIFIDGVYSHCVRKSAFQKLAVAGEAGETAAVATSEEISVAREIVSFLSVVPLYARVDLVRDKDDKPLLLELELIEPSLFLATAPAAAEALAEAILRRI